MNPYRKKRKSIHYWTRPQSPRVLPVSKDIDGITYIYFPSFSRADFLLPFFPFPLFVLTHSSVLLALLSLSPNLIFLPESLHFVCLLPFSPMSGCGDLCLHDPQLNGKKSRQKSDKLFLFGSMQGFDNKTQKITVLIALIHIIKT